MALTYSKGSASIDDILDYRYFTFKLSQSFSATFKSFFVNLRAEIGYA